MTLLGAADRTAAKRALPDGWQWLRLGEICEFAYGTGLPSRVRQTGSVPVYGSNGIVGYHSNALTSGPTIIIGRKGSIGEVHFAEYACWPIDTTYYIEQTKVEVDLVWLAWWLRALNLPYLNKAAAVPGLNRDDAYALEIPFPPFNSQQRIAAILSQEMAAVEQARAAIEAQLAAARKLPAAYLRAVFESAEAQGWPRRRLGEVAIVSGGIQKTPSRSPKEFHRPFLTVRNVQRGYLDLSNIERFETTPTEVEKYRLVPGDILIVEGNGSKDHIGRNAIFRGEVGDCIHQNHIIRVRANSEEIVPEFISIFLNSSQGRQQMMDRAETTSGLYTLSVSKIEGLEVPVPINSVQQSVVASLRGYLDGAILVQRSLVDQLNEINGLPAALLRSAFSGELSQPRLLALVKSAESPQGIFLKRGAVASYIVNRLHRQPTFGRVQFEKTLHLTEAHVGIDMGGKYERAAAGPYDRDFLNQLESMAEEQEWFTRHRRDGEGYFYRPGPQIADQLTAALTVLGDRRAEMDRMLDLMASMNTERAEIVATLFAAWNDFLLDGRRPSDAEIIREVRENWHPRKERFTPERLQGELDRMRQNGLTPKGIGPHTEMRHA